MRNHIRFLIFISLLLLNGNLLFAQRQAGEITKRLNRAGFENIRVFPYGNTVTVSYENSRYRNKATALSEILDSLSGYGYDTLKVITLVKDLPVVITKLSASVWKQYKASQITGIEMARQITISYNTDAVWNTLSNRMSTHPHINKIDIVVYPQVSIMNVQFNRNYEVQLNIAPALEVSLWRGMKFTGQVIFPVVNDYRFGEVGTLIRAGFVTLAQEFRLPGTIQGRAVVGKFNADRYGADMTLTKFLFGGVSYLSANAGYTGMYRYVSSNWYRDDLSTLTWFLKSGYFYKPYDMQLDITAGRYLMGDYGLRGDVTRYWGETSIGFYAMVAGSKFNGGFHFTIPLLPKRNRKNRSFEVRTPYYFDWEYNAGTEFNKGQIYKTRPNE
ncbi:MAG: YjbH domain-containing protein, partial [Bacteroidetes bacterium]|nr:YjbH domain-containing protein [Bacteroidota bacterium]